MKVLFCKKLAAFLCMKPPPSPSLEHPRLLYRKKWSVPIGNCCSNNVHCDNWEMTSVDATENDSQKNLLKEIRDLLKARVQMEEEQRYKDEKEEEITNDWMLAAAVLDRICAFVFAIILVAGTVVFITIIATHRL